ncbi:50S ribosomal protein L32 [Chlamydiales bacterium]|nr:50S ribosomal protein L32 [Chlamydiales bacterium]
MAVPRNRASNARKNQKRSHHAKTQKHPVRCSNCESLILPHCCCKSCGWYNNRQVIQVKESENRS